MTLTRPRPLSVAEMQAALEAARRGAFADSPPPPAGPDTDQRRRGEAAGTRAGGRGRQEEDGLADPQAGHGRRGGDTVPNDAGQTDLATGNPAPDPAGPDGELAQLDALLGERAERDGGALSATVLVLAAHAGAGASTVALLLSEAAADTAAAPLLIDCADPGSSGLAAASDTELAADDTGWRHARHGTVRIQRPMQPLASIAALPSPAPRPRLDVTEAPPALTVVDAGWPLRDVLSGPSWLTGLLEAASVVLVCRATVHGIRQTEHLLDTLPALKPWVVAIGPRHWPGPVTASCGPRLRAARTDQRLLHLPLDRAVDTTGLDSGPLPKRLQGAGRTLLTHLALSGAAPAAPQRPGRSRRARAHVTSERTSR
jgi:hypothetical protein